MSAPSQRVGYAALAGRRRRRFDPLAEPSLMGWWDASAPENTIVSGAFSQMADLSGRGHHVSQSTADQRPARLVADQNGLDVVSFDGVNDNSLLADGPNVTSRSYALVAAIFTANDKVSSDLLGVGDGAETLALGVTTSDAVTVGAFSDAVGSAPSGWRQVASAVAGWQVLTWIVDNANSTLRMQRNGVAIGSTVSNFVAPRLYNVGGELRLGSYLSAQGAFKGKLGEALLYGAVPGAEVLADAAQYLASRWL